MHRVDFVENAMFKSSGGKILLTISALQAYQLLGGVLEKQITCTMYM